ncbi:hypothetical protein R6Q59_017392 [Mikania micrantha]|uniref:C2H2-type domain-containing protein n=1 Tax=Mikania micrantha TaxID=192012 RepID=A0A5N6M3Z1_9ASTR|nr:hypothetical protein E3N88_36467 [Mikania micrantha]
MDHNFKSSNLMFHEKDYGHHQGQGFSWPRRNFTCNFCNKEYKSAQALGGHMNVHRRDKARLGLSSSPSVDPNPNPNPNFISPPIRYLPYHYSSLFPLVSTRNTKDDQQQRKLPLFSCSRVRSMEDIHGEEEGRVWKKYEILNMEMGFLKDEKINDQVDLELRLGRS